MACAIFLLSRSNLVYLACACRTFVISSQEPKGEGAEHQLANCKTLHTDLTLVVVRCMTPTTHASNYLLNSQPSTLCLQESEGDDAEASRVILAQDMGKGNEAARQSRVRLHEIGPRLEMEIVKVRHL